MSFAAAPPKQRDELAANHRMTAFANALRARRALKTAKALGLDVPTSLLARADEVIE